MAAGCSCYGKHVVDVAARDRNVVLGQDPSGEDVSRGHNHRQGHERSKKFIVLVGATVRRRGGCIYVCVCVTGLLGGGTCQ